MLPRILISHDDQAVEQYINDFIEKHSVKPFYVFRIRPEKTELTIDQVRSITKELVTHAESMRLFICYSFDTASIEAQNAFLKTLEEKQGKNQFLLVARSPYAILPTILSRGTLVKLGDESASLTVSAETRALLQTIKAGKMQFMGDRKITGIARETCLQLMDECIVYYRESLRAGDAQASAILKKIFHTRELLQYNNLNPQLAIDSLLIAISKIAT